MVAIWELGKEENNKLQALHNERQRERIDFLKYPQRISLLKFMVAGLREVC